MVRRDTANSTAQKILRASAEAFLDVGYRDSSLDEIASEAGVTKPTVYSHFGSKLGLLMSLLESHVTSNADALSMSLESSGDTAADLTAFGDVFFEHVMSRRAGQWRRLAMAEASEHPEIGKSIFMAGPARVLKTLGGYLAAETEAGRLNCDDPDLAAEQFIGLLLGIGPMREAAGMPRFSKAKQSLRRAAAVQTFLAAFACGESDSKTRSRCAV